VNIEDWSAAILPWAQGKRWWPVDPKQPAEVVGEVPLHDSADSHVTIALLKISESELIVQLPLLARAQHRETHDTMHHDSQNDIQAIGAVNGFALFDGTAEPEFWRAWAKSATLIPARDETEQQTRERLDRATSLIKPMGVEQSNTSVLLLGDDQPLIAKVFRVLHCGEHPEVQLPSALGDWEGIPRLNAYSYLEHDALGGSACAIVIADAVNDAQDGFVTLQSMAKRGDDPTPVSTQIGALIAHMHNRLEEAFGSSAGPSNENLKQRLNTSLSAAAEIDGALSQQDVSAIESTIRILTDADGNANDSSPAKAIRVHGDLHLGQLLLGSNGAWNVVDFEGEPLRPIAERSKPDSPARDIAGMLRSFDYAAESSGAFDADWLDAARTAFLAGYRSCRAISAADARMITAYELEKALYELQYEAKFRPSWIAIPLNGIRRLVRS
jgi:predicted trehalose synthase